MLNLEPSYKSFIVALKQKIYSAKTKAIVSANRLMIELYFEIGKEIVSNQQTQGWGKSVVEQMSKDLKNEFGEKRGYSSQNLWYMRQFYLTYKDNVNLQQLVGEIAWGSNIVIFTKCKDEKCRKYYLENCIEHGWNRNVLTHHIKTNLFERDDTSKKENNFEVTLKSELSELAVDIVKSEYNLEFLEVAKSAHENPAIGIILCSDKDSMEVEYSLLNTSQPMGVSTYSVKDRLPDEFKETLPTQEELQQLLGDKK